MTDPSPDPSSSGTPAESGPSHEPSPPEVPLSGVPASEAPLSEVPSPGVPSSEVPASEAVPMWAPPEPPQPATPIISVLRAAALVALGVGVLGAAVGWFWAEIAPRLQVIKSDRGFLYADAEPE